MFSTVMMGTVPFAPFCVTELHDAHFCSTTTQVKNSFSNYKSRGPDSSPF